VHDGGGTGVNLWDALEGRPNRAIGLMYIGLKP